MLPELTRDKARSHFFFALSCAAIILIVLVLSLAIRYWAVTLLAGAILIRAAFWLKDLSSVAWPDSPPRFPLNSFSRLSRVQRAFVELGFGLVWVVPVTLLLPRPLGWVVGAVLVAGSSLVFVLALKGKGWPTG